MKRIFLAFLLVLGAGLVSGFTAPIFGAVMQFYPSGETQNHIGVGVDNPLPVELAQGSNAVDAHTVTATVTIATDADLTNVVDTEDYTMMVIEVPSNFDGTDLKFHCTDSASGTPTEIKDESDASCTTTTAASQYAGVKSGTCALLVAACRFLAIETVTDQADTNTAFVINLKR